MKAADAPHATIGAGAGAPAYDPDEIARLVEQIARPLRVVRQRPSGRVGVVLGEDATGADLLDGCEPLAVLPPIHPASLGDPGFLEAHRVRYPYMTGSMANGIASVALVKAAARAGLLSSFGAAGLSPERVEAAIVEIRDAVGPDVPFASNLIHSPNEPDLEDAVVDVYQRRGVTTLEASAYMGLTPSIVRYACTGLATDGQGRVARRNHVIAKVSRPEVARRFLSPAPADVLAKLVAAGRLSSADAALAARIPLAEDITVEADSAGHTDNRPLVVIVPAILALRDEIAARHGYAQPPRVGAGGGLGTPAAVAAAFALGAAYVVTGSVNQAAVESGLSVEGRALLAAAELADVAMAPAADMFELGVKLQVLKRGTMFAMRAGKLWEVYSSSDSIDAIPGAVRARIEREIFQTSLDQVWADTRRFFERRDPREVERAEREPKHKLALVFRWYLGKASRWAITGESARRMDYQIWCGPAMGAFNAWAAGSFLAAPEGRGVVQIARNLLLGAAVATRAQQLRTLNVPVPQSCFNIRPRPIESRAHPADEPAHPHAP